VFYQVRFVARTVTYTLRSRITPSAPRSENSTGAKGSQAGFREPTLLTKDEKEKKKKKKEEKKKTKKKKKKKKKKGEEENKKKKKQKKKNRRRVSGGGEKLLVSTPFGNAGILFSMNN